MASGYRREEWNSLLDAVNGILEDPPEDTDCDPVSTIPHVPPEYRWGKGDIRAVHDKLKQTCPDITFDEIPETWKESIIGEILGKLGQAWCDCEDDEPDCDPSELFPCPFGTPYTIIEFEAPCDYRSPYWGGEMIDWCYFDYGAYVNSLGVLGPPGFKFMNWLLYRVVIETEATTVVAGGAIGTGNDSEDPAVVALCDGTVGQMETDTSGNNGMLFKRDYHIFRLRLSCAGIGDDFTDFIADTTERIADLEEDIAALESANANLEAALDSAAAALESALAAATTPEEEDAAHAAYEAAENAANNAYLAAVSDLEGSLSDMENEKDDLEEDLEDAQERQAFANQRIITKCCLIEPEEDDDPPPP